MGLFGDWANTACGVNMAVCRNTAHRFNFRCDLWNRFFVPMPLFEEKAVFSIQRLYGCISPWWIYIICRISNGINTKNLKRRFLGSLKRKEK